jgi:hypothetical protein
LSHTQTQNTESAHVQYFNNVNFAGEGSPKDLINHQSLAASVGIEEAKLVLNDGHRDSSGLVAVGLNFSGRVVAIQDALVHRDHPVLDVDVSHNGEQVERKVIVGTVDGQEKSHQGARPCVAQGNARCQYQPI